MIELAPFQIWNSWKRRVKIQSWEGLLPSHDSLGPDRLALRANRTSSKWWLLFYIEAPSWRWWIKLPDVSCDLSQETSIVWLNSKPLQLRLSVREAWIATTKLSCNSIPDLEVLAYAKTKGEMMRLWMHDRTEIDGTGLGVCPRIRAGRKSKGNFTPSFLPGTAHWPKVLHDTFNHTQQQLAAGKRFVCTPEGWTWT